MKSDDDKIILTNIDEEAIEDNNITFRWWRRVGNGPWVRVDVPPNQPWVDIELDTDSDTYYKCEILDEDDKAILEIERSFQPPVPPPHLPQPNFWQSMFLWFLAGLFAIVGILLIVIAVNKRKEKQKKIT